MIEAVLVRFACLAVSHTFAALRLLRTTEGEKDVEILALRHQLAVLQRQLGDQRPRLRPDDRALFAASTVWKILKIAGVDPAPRPENCYLADFLCSLAGATGHCVRW